MELKEMIEGLRTIDCYDVIDLCDHGVLSAVAEALALVAWAEEQGATVKQIDADWVCILMDGSMHANSFLGDTFLGAIRAAKEAYEQSR